MAGNPVFFQKQHVEQHTFNASSVLAEQAIHCLELVAELVESGLPFQFKGGNSLLLILQEPKRFSIDVDIATGSSREEIEQCLEGCIRRFGIFNKWERRQHKTKPWIPLASYYVYYNSHFTDDPETSIMLDVQLRRSPYRTEFKPVVCGDIYKSDVKVELPLPSSIIGDKLLTLGPTTLGIPLGKGKEAQRLKHVFDISRLLNTRPKLSYVRESFIKCLEHENEIQKHEQEAEAVIKDTMAFCWSIVPFAEIPSGDMLAPIVQENARGIVPFASHLFDAGYNWKQLQIDMAKVALVMAAIAKKEISDSQFESALSGEGEKRPLLSDALKQNPEALRYWEIIQAWTGGVS